VKNEGYSLKYIGRDKGWREEKREGRNTKKKYEIKGMIKEGTKKGIKKAWKTRIKGEK
jgi:hypothetical protein